MPFDQIEKTGCYPGFFDLLITNCPQCELFVEISAQLKIDDLILAI